MNVVLIMLDSLRADHVGAYGNRWIKTPALDALARESVVFTRAFNEALPTIPVRRALHTGKRTFPYTSYQTYAGITTPVIGWEPVPSQHVTLAEMLQGAGYATAMVTDTSPFLEPWMNFSRGFDQFITIRGQEGDRYGSRAAGQKAGIDRFLTPKMKGSREARGLLQYWAVASQFQREEDYFAARVFGTAMRWLDENEGTEPFFLSIDSFDPHEPWYPPQRFVDLYDPGYEGTEVITPKYGPVDYLTERELQHMRARYAAEASFVDSWVGKFLDRLRAKGLLERTLVVLTADHGHLLGEHGLTGKLPQALYMELVHVPLLVRQPLGAGGGRRVEGFAGAHDIAPTVLGSCGVDAPYELDGRDLQPLIAGKASKVRDYATSAMGSVRGTYVWANDGEHMLIARSTGEQARLFNLRDDPEQRHDIAASKPRVAQRMMDLIRAEAGGPIAELPPRELPSR